MRVSTQRVVEGFAVAVLLLGIFGFVVAEVAIQGDVQLIAAVRGSEAFGAGKVACGTQFGIGSFVINRNVAHLVVVGCVDSCAEVEFLVFQRGVERAVQAGSPVAVDVDFVVGTRAVRLVIRHAVGNGVQRVVESHADAETAHGSGRIALVTGVQVVGERGFQVRISVTQTQGIGDVDYFLQVFDVGCIAPAVVAQIDAFAARKVVVGRQRRRPVQYVLPWQVLAGVRSYACPARARLRIQ